MPANNHNGKNKKNSVKEKYHLIEDVLSNLPEEYRVILTLKELNGMTMDEIAGLLSINKNDLKIKLKNAKIQLKKTLILCCQTTELFEFNLIYCDKMVERVMKEINEL